MSKSNVLICFCKHPSPGMVKSRLAKSIGNHNAAKTYQGLLKHTLQNTKHSCSNKVLYCYPDTHHPTLHELAELFDFQLRKQVDGGLGEKMQRAIAEHIDKNINVVLI